MRVSQQGLIPSGDVRGGGGLHLKFNFFSSRSVHMRRIGIPSTSKRRIGKPAPG